MSGTKVKAVKRSSATSTERSPEDLAVLILRYTVARAREVGWRAGDMAIARGEGAEDVAQDALASLYEDRVSIDGVKTRKWNRGECPDPLEHMKSFVNSRLSSLRRLYEYNGVSGGADVDREADAMTPEQHAIAKQRDQWKAQVREHVEAQLLEENLLLRMYELVEKKELDRPSDLAPHLGVSVDEVKNAKKRFARCWERAVEAVGADPSVVEEDSDG